MAACQDGSITDAKALRFTMHRCELLGTTRGEFARQVTDWGFAAVHAARLWRYLYRELLSNARAMADLPAELRERLCAEFVATSLSVTRETKSPDGLTTKYLLALADGRQIETVLMRYRGRVTACVSSQAGCALGCVFCATGQRGFERNLSAGEIVAQALFIEGVLRAERKREATEHLRNVVVMGMGEPLLNYDSVVRALEILADNAGLGIAAKRLTLSTVGVVPGIRRLADEDRPYSLAVSLHATTQEERAALLPAAHTWPLDELLDACRYYVAKSGRKIFFEWTLIAGVNDSSDHANALAKLLAGIQAHVNLIPLNSTDGFVGETSPIEKAREFQRVLQSHDLPSTLRQKRGIDIAAGCGQLAAAGE